MSGGKLTHREGRKQVRGERDLEDLIVQFPVRCQVGGEGVKVFAQGH